MHAEPFSLFPNLTEAMAPCFVANFALQATLLTRNTDLPLGFLHLNQLELQDGPIAKLVGSILMELQHSRLTLFEEVVEES